MSLTINKNKKLRVNFQRVQEELIYQEHLSNEFIAKLFELDFDQIIELAIEKQPLLLQSEESIITVIPPYPCSTCFNNELKIIEGVCLPDSISLFIIVPQSRKRDAAAVLQNKKNTMITSYDDYDTVNGIVQHIDQFIYLHLKEGTIKEATATSKLNSNISRLFLNKVIH